MTDELPEQVAGCPHPDAHRSDYTGTLCTACYRDIEMRLPGLGDNLALSRRLAAPGTVSAYRYGERVQETAGQPTLIIDAHLLDLGDQVYTAAAHAVIVAAPLIYTDPPYDLRNATSAGRYREGAYTAHSVEAWLIRNLQWIAALDLAWDLIDSLADALDKLHKAVNPAPPRQRVIRGACSACLDGRVTIELRARGTFYSTCGGCGKTGPVHVRAVEAVLSENGNSQRSSQSDRAHPNDAMALQSDRHAASDQTRA